jgi:hypothetical protein
VIREVGMILQEHEEWYVQDSSKLEDYLSCPRLYFYKHVLGWRGEAPNHHLECGKAWHLAQQHLLLKGYNAEAVREAYNLFCESYHENFPPELQTDLEPKSSRNVLDALVRYCLHYANDRFNVLYTEVAGVVPMLEGMQLHFKIDSIIEDLDNDNMIMSLEHKTAKDLGRLFQDKWALHTQPGTYNHVLYCLFPFEKVYGVKINGMAVFKKKEPEFLRVPVRRTLEMMEDWLYNTSEWLIEIDQDFSRLDGCKEDALVMEAFKKNPNSCTDYFGCQFHDFCVSWSNPLQHAYEPPSGFKVEYWDPRSQGTDAKYEFVDNQLKEVVKGAT